jgi:hypothetical protein
VCSLGSLRVAGEVDELLAGLREASVERDMVKQREVVKRVIAFMTVGIDLSRLFPEMVMVSIPHAPLIPIMARARALRSSSHIRDVVCSRATREMSCRRSWSTCT